jgi:hypothetical protein
LALARSLDLEAENKQAESDTEAVGARSVSFDQAQRAVIGE